MSRKSFIMILATLGTSAKATGARSFQSLTVVVGELYSSRDR